MVTGTADESRSVRLQGDRRKREATAHPFDVTFPIHTNRFQYISAKFVATAIGHAAINSYTYKDIRDKGRRSLPTKTVA